MGIPAYVHLLRAKDLIDSSYAEPLDVPALARAAFCSEAHFIRSFKRAFGETPHRYLLRRRIERARREVPDGADRAALRDRGDVPRQLRQLVQPHAARRS